MKMLPAKGRIEVVNLLERSSGNIGAELGVAAGDFSAELLDSGCFQRLYGVDAYADHHDVDEYKAVVRRFRSKGQYSLLRLRFDEALDLFDDASLDFIYIDGYAHTGQEGGETIHAWARKVKINGVISGHDYDSAFPLTTKAVDEFVALNGFELHVLARDGDYPTWAVVKTDDTLGDGPRQELQRAGGRPGASVPNVAFGGCASSQTPVWAQGSRSSMIRGRDIVEAVNTATIVQE